MTGEVHPNNQDADILLDVEGGIRTCQQDEKYWAME
jgi:hypothetical protein